MSLFAQHRNVIAQPLPESHAVLRQQVCEFARNHSDLVREAVECEYGGLEAFIVSMRRPGTYADGNVANIVCVMFDVNLHIHTVDGVMEAYPQSAEGVLEAYRESAHESSTTDATSQRRRPALHIVYIDEHWEATTTTTTTAAATTTR